MKIQRRFRSLASRMAAVALLQLVLLALTGAVIALITRPLGEARPGDHLDTRAIAAIAEDSDALGVELARLRKERISVSIYNSQKQLIATNVDPPLAPPRGPRPPPPDGGGPRRGDGPPRGGPPFDHFGPRGDRPFFAPLHIADDRGFLVARGELAQPPGWSGPILILVSGFLILVLGAIVTARWIVRPIDRLARTARALGSGDLGARSRLERTDEIGELGYRFDEMADRMETLMRSEKELFANVAHELRTPLARIGVALDLAGEGDAQAARASLGEIAVDVGELERIVDDILTTMRFEVACGGAGTTIPLRRQPTPPREIVEAAVARHEARHPERPLEVHVDDELPPLDVDPMLVRRVLDNLLENAHKYTPDPTTATRLAARAHAGAVIFEVGDHGSGIASDDLPRVFTAFFRADRSRSRETGGVGLGLTLAKRIVEAHGGTIYVDSTPGTGTTVRVELPARAADTN